MQWPSVGKRDLHKTCLPLSLSLLFFLQVLLQSSASHQLVAAAVAASTVASTVATPAAAAAAVANLQPAALQQQCHHAAPD